MVEDEGQRGGGGEREGTPAESFAARVNQLVEAGLEKYGAGDLLGALCEWEHALSLDPEARRAAEYIAYVRDNFAALLDGFRRAAEAGGEAAAPAGPVPAVVDEGGSAYDSLEITSSVEDDFDGGWQLDEIVAPLPPPPGGAAPPMMPVSLVDELAGVGVPLEGELDVGPGGELSRRASDLAPAQSGELEVASAGLLRVPRDEEVTMPGGEEPQRLPTQPALSFEALAALGGNMPVVTITPREAPPPTPPGDLLDELGGLEPGGVPDDRVGGDEPASAPDFADGVDEQTSELPHLAAMRRLVADLQRANDVEADRGGFAEEGPTMERRGALLGLAFGDPDAREGAGERDFDDGGATVERRVLRADPRLEARRGDPAVIVDEALLREEPARGVELEAELPDGDVGPAWDRAPALEVTAREGAGGVENEVPAAGAGAVDPRGAAPADAAGDPEEPEAEPEADPVADPEAEPGEPERARTRERIQSLLQLAREFSARNDHLAAVEAAEAAASEDPDGTIAPIILHRHRELLCQIYEGHLGPMSQVPLVAVPLHEIAASHLDHRTGFLLSRIDGMLSYEDILDIAGMPRLEAYRILSSLLRMGLIEARG